MNIGNNLPIPNANNNFRILAESDKRKTPNSLAIKNIFQSAGIKVSLAKPWFGNVIKYTAADNKVYYINRASAFKFLKANDKDFKCSKSDFKKLKDSEIISQLKNFNLNPSSKLEMTVINLVKPPLSAVPSQEEALTVTSFPSQTPTTVTAEPLTTTESTEPKLTNDEQRDISNLLEKEKVYKNIKTQFTIMTDLDELSIDEDAEWVEVVYSNSVTDYLNDCITYQRLCSVDNPLSPFEEAQKKFMEKHYDKELIDKIFKVRPSLGEKFQALKQA